MTSIIPFLREATFDPEQIHAMGVALDRACNEIVATPLLRDTMAKCIIAFAQHGERDPERLFEAALAGFGVQQKQSA